MSDADAVRARVLDALRGVIDPELGINIVDLGLIYDVAVEGDVVTVSMTMTSAACPLGEEILEHAEYRLRGLADVAHVELRLVWDPPWTAERMSEAARRDLGWEP